MRQTETHIYFHGGLFSNWAPTMFRGIEAWKTLEPMIRDSGIPVPDRQSEISRRFIGHGYNCVEQWMMAAKAWLFDDIETLKAIHLAKTPKEQKALGRKVSPFRPAIWDKVNLDVVTAGIVAKFTVDGRMRKEILDTGDLAFCEGSPFDTIWGVGLDWRSKEIENMRNWRGKNLLGVALGRARDIIRNEGH